MARAGHGSGKSVEKRAEGINMIKTRKATSAFKHFLRLTGCFENCQNNSLYFDPLFLAVFFCQLT